MKKLAGDWSISFPDGTRRVTISTEGLVIDNDGTKESRKSMITLSDNSDFPSSQGWYKINNLVKDSTWDFVRLLDNGDLQIQHFCSYDDRDCKGKHKNSDNYCCFGTGKKIQPGDFLYFISLFL